MSAIMAKRDREIQEAVLQELKWDSHVDENNLRVEVNSGVVTLNGISGSYAMKVAAQEAAHRVAGVLDVANDIRVPLLPALCRTDTEIAQSLRWALEWDALIPHEKILSTVSEGFVTLNGEVPFEIDRRHVERVVRNLTGVRDVSNLITVAGETEDAILVQQSVEHPSAPANSQDRIKPYAGSR